MKRNISVLGIFITLFLSTGCKSDNIQTSTYKHVVFILSDDHSTEVVGAYGNEIIRTPNLDALANEGIRFTHAYANSPICSASRQSLLTGKYPHSTGVNLLFTPFPDKGNVTLAEHLREEGFKTALFGKAHFNNWIWSSMYQEGLPDHGFTINDQGQSYKNYLQSGAFREIPEEIQTFSKNNTSIASRWNAEGLPSPCYDEDCEGTFLARQAISFMKDNQQDRFLLWLAFHEPHMPFAFPIEYTGKYSPTEVPLPQGSPEDDRWVPAIFRNLSEDERRGIIASYYTSVEYMDKNVGLVLDALDSLGIAEETLVIYLGDQGYLLNDHKRFEKHTMWAESVKAPLIIRGKKNAGKVSDALVEFIDIVPTVTKALGVANLDDAQGKSFLDILETDSTNHRQSVFSEYLIDNKAMIANKEWKYIFTTGKKDLGIGYATGFGPSGIHQRLYNLIRDPDETTNLAYDPQHKDKLEEMQTLMLNRFMETHPEANKVPDSFTRLGKLVWFCEPRDIGGETDELPLRVFEKSHEEQE